MEFELYLTCPRGLEEICKEELEEVGCKDVKADFGGVSFVGELKDLYNANLHSRVGMHVLQKMYTFNCKNEKSFYDGIFRYNWEEFIAPFHTISINVRHRRSWIRNSQFIALRAKDAIVDRIKSKVSSRPSIDRKDPDIPIDIFLDGDKCTVYLNTSGQPLYKRGFRQKIHKAAINESLAAGLIKLTGWNKKDAFYDPMCGSGTFAIEATTMALGIPPRAENRSYAFINYFNYDKKLWENLKSLAFKNKRDKMPLIWASDIMDENIDMANEAASQAKISNYITFYRQNVKYFRPKFSNGLIITNPPYGERIGEEDALDYLYSELNTKFTEHCKNHNIFMIVPDVPYLEHIELPIKSKLPIRNGNLDCNFIQY